MLQAVRLFLLVSISLFDNSNGKGVANAQWDAFGANINLCLFGSWSQGKNAVLAKDVDCEGRRRTGLCYGNSSGPALFAVCYNKCTLIPEFTGHIVKPAAAVSASGRGRRTGRRRGRWRNEGGMHAPVVQASVKDYSPFKQQVFLSGFFNLNAQRFYSRGHLTPNGDFAIGDRELTMVNTNIAPQWQRFNGGNWVTLEKAVRSYSDKNGRKIFVFTGTGGISMRTDKRCGKVPILLNRRVFVPRYFWKAVCDPVNGSSVAFVAENPTGMNANNKIVGCNGKEQTQDKGVIHCYSLDTLKVMHPRLLLPPFAQACAPSVRGAFLDDYLDSLK